MYEEILSNENTPDIVLVGHIIEDVLILLDGSRVESLGGMVTYASAVLSNLGGYTGLVSTVGKDFPDEYENYFRELQIDIEGLHKDSEYTTRGVLTQINEKDREFIVEHMAGMLKPNHIPDRYLGGDLFYFGPMNSFKEVKTEDGIKKIHDELPLETIKYVAENSDAIIMLDAQGYTRLKDENGKNRSTSWDDKEEFYKYIDILKVNDDPEAPILSGKDDPIEAAKKIYKDLKKAHKSSGRDSHEVVIVTQGKEGAIVVEDNIVYHINSAIPERVVDTTGAGDSFGAGFAWSYRKNHSASEAAVIGSIVSSYVIEKAGADGFPDINMVMERYREQEDRLRPRIIDIIDDQET